MTGTCVLREGGGGARLEWRMKRNKATLTSTVYMYVNYSLRIVMSAHMRRGWGRNGEEEGGWRGRRRGEGSPTAGTISCAPFFNTAVLRSITATSRPLVQAATSIVFTAGVLYGHTVAAIICTQFPRAECLSNVFVKRCNLWCMNPRCSFVQLHPARCWQRCSPRYSSA